MEAKKLDYFRKRLLKEKERLGAELKNLEAENAVVSENEVSTDDSFEDHMLDAASTTFDREKDFSLEVNIRDLLAQVDNALRKIDLGIYGVCSSCQMNINEERLKALPYAELCITCKKREERQR